MKRINFTKLKQLLFSMLIMLLIINCSSESPKISIPQINVVTSSLSFGEIEEMSHSVSQSIEVSGSDLTSVIKIIASDNFQVSLDDIVFTSEVSISYADANSEKITVYVRFSPLKDIIGDILGNLSIENSETEPISITLNGIGLVADPGLPHTYNYVTFVDQELGFGDGLNQSAEKTFNLHTDLSNIESIKMFLQIDCPSTGCDDWDRFANIKVKDKATGKWFEIGRYITPYWTGTQQLERGLEFDVTDFKSLLTGNTEIKIYIENWTTKVDIVTLDFDYIEGTPDYPYYAVSEVLGFHANSISGVPYGISHNLDLDKSIQIPANAETAHLRTIISGWGHATPNDVGGRGCAEWCFRTHNVKINGNSMFQHDLASLGCASNPINNQSPGNWKPDRAGWCPGMVVPSRIDNLGISMSGTLFTFEYDYEDWVSNTLGGDAFYATSTYIVVKSNTPIAKPIVTD